MTVGVGHLLAVSAALAGIGLFGLLSRRDLLGSLIALVLLLQASVVALVGFARFGFSDARPLGGFVFALVVLVGLLVEVAAGVGLLIVLHRRGGGDALADGAASESRFTP